MKKLDFNWLIKDIEGNEIKEAKASDLLGQMLLQQKQFDAIKLFDWAVTLKKTGIIEVDNSDFDKIKEFIKSDEQYLAVITKAQLLKFVNGVD
jgi:hypothetical protein